MSAWRPLGGIAPTELVDARLQLHHAAQVVATAGVTWLPAAPDDSHPNLGWDEESGLLLGHPLPVAGLRFGLGVADLSLGLVDARGEFRERLALDGRSLEEAYAWLTRVASEAGLTEPATGITRASYELPGHDVASGGAFARGSGVDFEELASWFANASALLETHGHRLGASTVRVWPHHFDVGSLLAVAQNDDGSLAKSVGFGLSPGDESYPEPYLYVSPWPYPEVGTLEALSAGHWHGEGYVAAILRGRDLARGSAEQQSERAVAFLDEAYAASCSALGD